MSKKLPIFVKMAEKNKVKHNYPTLKQDKGFCAPTV